MYTNRFTPKAIPLCAFLKDRSFFKSYDKLEKYSRVNAANKFVNCFKALYKKLFNSKSFDLKVFFSINGWNRLNRFISKGLMYNKKISFVISVCSLILMGTSLISARYFLSFYLSNLSYIIETYFK